MYYYTSSQPTRSSTVSRQDIIHTSWSNEMKFKIPYLFLGMVVIIIIIFLAIFSIGYFYHPPTLTELHQKNYLGKETERNFIYNGYSFVKVSNSVANVDFWWTQHKRGEDVYDIPF